MRGGRCVLALLQPGEEKTGEKQQRVFESPIQPTLLCSYVDIENFNRIHAISFLNSSFLP